MTNDRKNDMIMILGVTAGGKARLAHELARHIGAEIVSIDSMKVYRRMDIGTAKPPARVREEVKYHLIDVVEPQDSFSVARYLELADTAIEDVRGRGKPVIASGGTAMYIKALIFGLFEGPGTDEELRRELKARIEAEGSHALHGELARIDPEAAARIHPNDSKRIIRAIEVARLAGRSISDLQRQWQQPRPEISHDWTIIGLRREKADASHRINSRVKRMFHEGLLEEVRRLLAEPRPLSPQASSAIGYAETIAHLEGKYSLEETVELVKKNTRRLAKSQRTWFKTFEGVNWLDASPDETFDTILSKALDLIHRPERL